MGTACYASNYALEADVLLSHLPSNPIRINWYTKRGRSLRWPVKKITVRFRYCRLIRIFLNELFIDGPHKFLLEELTNLLTCFQLSRLSKLQRRHINQSNLPNQTKANPKNMKQLWLLMVPGIPKIYSCGSTASVLTE